MRLAAEISVLRISPTLPPGFGKLCGAPVLGALPPGASTPPWPPEGGCTGVPSGPPGATTGGTVPVGSGNVPSPAAGSVPSTPSRPGRLAAWASASRECERLVLLLPLCSPRRSEADASAADGSTCEALTAVHCGASAFLAPSALA